MQLAAQIHQATGRFPSDERFGLLLQMRRAAVSIPSNLAEGAARRTTREFLAFLHIARGSQAELDTQLRLATEFQYLAPECATDLLLKTEEVGRMLTALIAALRRRDGR